MYFLFDQSIVWILISVHMCAVVVDVTVIIRRYPTTLYTPDLCLAPNYSVWYSYIYCASCMHVNKCLKFVYKKIWKSKKADRFLDEESKSGKK